MNFPYVFTLLKPAASLERIARPADEIPHLLVADLITNKNAAAPGSASKPVDDVAQVIETLAAYMSPTLIRSCWLAGVGIDVSRDSQQQRRRLGDIRKYSSIIADVKSELAAAIPTTGTAAAIITMVVADLCVKISSPGQILGFAPYNVFCSYHEDYFPLYPAVEDCVQDCLEGLLLDALAPLTDLAGPLSIDAKAEALFGPQAPKVALNGAKVDPNDLEAITRALDGAADLVCTRLKTAALIAKNGRRTWEVEISNGMATFIDETFSDNVAGGRVDRGVPSDLVGCANLLSNDFAKHGFANLTDSEAIRTLMATTYNGKRHWEILVPRMRRYGKVAAADHVSSFAAFHFRDTTEVTSESAPAAGLVLVWRGLQGSGPTTGSFLYESNNASPVGAGQSGAYGATGRLSGGSMHSLEDGKLDSLFTGMSVEKLVDFLAMAYEDVNLPNACLVGLRQLDFTDVVDPATKLGGLMPVNGRQACAPMSDEFEILGALLADNVMLVKAAADPRPNVLDPSKLRFVVKRSRVLRTIHRAGQANGFGGVSTSGDYTYLKAAAVVTAALPVGDPASQPVSAKAADEEYAARFNANVWALWPSWVNDTLRTTRFGVLKNLAVMGAAVNVSYPVQSTTSASFTTPRGASTTVLTAGRGSQKYDLTPSSIYAFGSFYPDMKAILSTHDAGKRMLGSFLIGLLMWLSDSSRNAKKVEVEELLGTSFDPASLALTRITTAKDVFERLVTYLTATLMLPGMKQRMVDVFMHAVNEHNQGKAAVDQLVTLPLQGRYGLGVAEAHLDLVAAALNLPGLAPHARIMSQAIDPARAGSVPSVKRTRTDIIKLLSSQGQGV